MTGMKGLLLQIPNRDGPPEMRKRGGRKGGGKTNGVTTSGMTTIGAIPGKTPPEVPKTTWQKGQEKRGY